MYSVAPPAQLRTYICISSLQIYRVLKKSQDTWLLFFSFSFSLTSQVRPRKRPQDSRLKMEAFNTSVVIHEYMEMIIMYWNLATPDFYFNICFLPLLITMSLQQVQIVSRNFLQEVSFETKSGRKTAKFLIQINYLCFALILGINFSHMFLIQGYFVRAVLLVVLPVWMELRPRELKRDLDCKDCYKEFVKDCIKEYYERSLIMFYLPFVCFFRAPFELSMNLCWLLLFKDFIMALIFGYYFMTGDMIGNIIRITSLYKLDMRSSFLVSNRFTSNYPSDSLTLDFEFDDESQDITYKVPNLYRLTRLKDCRHKDMESNHLSIPVWIDSIESTITLIILSNNFYNKSTKDSLINYYQRIVDVV